MPAALYLGWSSGSPVPTTFQTQQGQAAIGFTGFDIGTSFFPGMMILLRGWSDQSSLYYLWLPYIVLSIRFVLPSVWWSWGIVAWGIAHFAGYTWFDLFPYPWSYAPLVPGVVILAGLVFQGLSESAEDWDTLRYFLEDTFRPFLVLAQAFSLRAIVAGFTAERPPEAAQAKVLQTGSADDVYRAVGEWINAHTPENATVAAHDVGIIGYYADRAMIDLLGILQPEVAQAVGRRDLFYAIPHFLPDTIVLGENLIIYDIWLHGDPWFAAHYKPVKRFSDERFERFGNSPMVVFQRVYDPMPLIEQTANIDFSRVAL